MPNFQVPGATLFYETNGSGPALLLIPGASGTGNVFKKTANKLAPDFTAITYDRRGFSKSYLTGKQDYANRLDQDADDAAALLKHVAKGKPSFVFATSSGAVVGRTLLLRHPDSIETIMLHEPPLCKALPDGIREPYSEKTKNAYDVYREKGAIAAMEGFIDVNFTPREAKIMRLGAQAHVDPFGVGNQLYWFEFELLVYPFAELRIEEMKKYADKIIFATSEEASDLPAGMVPQILAEKLGKKAIVLPGAHLGYLTEPEDFAQAITTYME
ncbi:alpha/beta-hydrolase [Aulographum hederae CBS 113979]|uniref:Alpha/beta-hydrolase n=1 Tax=Aulographum hederae CBS 113979 TaxID=1176131 RepID=A0A6G1GNT2_9PEZI|nr:alpha/beta-hydrolase [Aulographum hederae CBS 113979]